MKDKTKTIIAIAVILIIVLSECGVKYYYRHKYDKDIVFAKAEAEDHIAEKYGFEDISLERDEVYPTYFTDKNNFSTAFSANCGGEEFSVVFFKENGKAECFDNYQQEEIRAALEKYFCENFPNGSIVSMYFKGKGVSYPYSGFMYKDVFFDGENITEILSKCQGKLEMAFYDTEFSQSDIEKIIPKDSRLEAEFASFDTKEFCDVCVNEATDHSYSEHFYLILEKYAPHLTDYIYIKNDGVNGFNVDIMENDEFLYAYFPVEPRKLATRTDITAEPVKTGKVTEIFTRHGEENYLGKQLSVEYYFDSLYGDVWIYYPLEKLDGYDIEKVGLAWFSAGGMSDNHNIEKARVCGDYAVFNMPYGEDYFRLVYSENLDEYEPTD